MKENTRRRKSLFCLLSAAVLCILWTVNVHADDKIPMDQCNVSFARTEYAYTGNGITPIPKVTYKKKKLKKDMDYNIVYKDNVNVGTATVTLIGLGKYTGTTTGSYSIVKGKQEINADDIKATYGDAPININAVAKSPLSYKSSDDSVAEVSQVGTVTIRGAGEAKITIKAEESGNLKAAKKIIKVKVSKADTEVKAYGGHIKIGETHDLKVESSSGGEMSYTSSNNKIAKVSKDGIVEGRKKGTVTITVESAATKDYKAGSASVDVEVD